MAEDKDAADISIELTDQEADAKAQSVFENDPFFDPPDKRIPPSLLSATDIVAYAKATSFINPFYATKAKLKHASYEACIGSNAYMYDSRGMKRLGLTKDGYLKVPANSIVFVESDVTFRLPRYIAARFNLQIKHVHRGLLLGTGPLVDPGFRGRLLIPLHNLTSEDYYIHKDDGFIWIEFTRTTYDESRDEHYGDYPEYKNISDGMKWLHKAAYSEHMGRSVHIRSSILPAVEEAEKRSKRAESTALSVRNFGFAGAVALLLTFALIMLGEIYSNRAFMQAAYDIKGSLPSDEAGLSETVSQTTANLAADLRRLRNQLSADLTSLREQLNAMETRVQDLQQQSTPPARSPEGGAE